MDLLRMISELKRERDLLDEAIELFERLLAGRGKRRGRPPKWFKQAEPKRRNVKPSKKSLAALVQLQDGEK